MVSLFDDGISLMTLDKAPNIELLGITVVVGNSWPKEGLSYGIRQLEAINSTTPIYEGLSVTLDPTRMDKRPAEAAEAGGDGYLGAGSHLNPSGTWQDVYINLFKERPRLAVQQQNAVDFIIEQVHKYPGEVIILAIGPCTNIATALKQDPDVATLAKEIVYMGGAFFVPGTTVPQAGFNWWTDPEAARITVRAPWKRQTVISLDVCNKVIMTGRRYFSMKDSSKNPIIQDLFENHFLTPQFTQAPESTSLIWDVIASSIIIDPSLLLDAPYYYIDVDDTHGKTYGKSNAYSTAPFEGAQKARIVEEVDIDRLWTLVESAIRSF